MRGGMEMFTAIQYAKTMPTITMGGKLLKIAVIKHLAETFKSNDFEIGMAFVHKICARAQLLCTPLSANY